MVKKARNEKLKQFMNNIAVKTNTVCKGFGAGETRTEVLKDVNFEARMGELLMLVGPSGCGKTTLLSVIAGTLGVDRGEVEVFDSPSRLFRRDLTIPPRDFECRIYETNVPMSIASGAGERTVSGTHGPSSPGGFRPDWHRRSPLLYE